MGSIPKNPKESHRIPKNPKESHRIPKNPTESQRIPKNPKESQRIPKNPKESHRIPQNPKESQRISKNWPLFATNSQESDGILPPSAFRFPNSENPQLPSIALPRISEFPGENPAEHFPEIEDPNPS